jgi:calcineurin-like phosphoesterase family protein
MESEHFFISDLHHGHDRDFIWGAPGRRYNNVGEMNKDIEDKWNTNISNGDIVWHLGDTIFKDYNGMKCLEMYSKLNFKVLYEIWGNHRSGTQTIYQELCKDKGLVNREQYPMELKLSEHKKVVFLGNYAEIMIDGQRIILCHYPIESWNGIRKGNWHLHGHSHCNLPNTKNLKRLDVGWDFKRKPLSFPEVRDEMKNLNGLPDDHH